MASLGPRGQAPRLQELADWQASPFGICRSLMSSYSCDVLIVGAGPAGLAAAIELRRLGVARVVVLERERDAGGVPRHSAHTGFGLRDLRRLLSGPQYAARYVHLATQAGIELRTE